MGIVDVLYSLNAIWHCDVDQSNTYPLSWVFENIYGRGSQCALLCTHRYIMWHCVAFSSQLAMQSLKKMPHDVGTASWEERAM